LSDAVDEPIPDVVGNLTNRREGSNGTEKKMAENKSLLGSGAGMVARNKRYIIWFYLLNLFLGLFGTVSFVMQARTVLEHSLYADRLLHGFDLVVVGEMFTRPEFGPTAASGLSAL